VTGVDGAVAAVAAPGDVVAQGAHVVRDEFEAVV
jgi:hypothetical protein